MRARGYMALALAVGAYAQAPVQLSLPEAIQLGLRPGQRADTALAAEGVARARSVAQASRAALLPLVEATVSGGERKQNLAAQGFGGNGQGLPLALNPAFTNFDGRPTVSATLLNPGQWKAWQASRMDVRRAERERDVALDSAAQNIASLYLACLQAQAEVRAAASSWELAKSLRQAAEARLAAGTVTRVDLTRAKSQEAADYSAMLAQQQTELEARAALFKAINVEGDAKVELLPLPPLAMPSQLTFDEALATAHAQRWDLRVREEAVRVASERAKAVAWERLPTITGSFDIGRNGLSPADTAWTRNGTAGLKVTLYDFGRRGEREAQAAITLREERIRLEELQREIRRQVRVALGRLVSAEAQVTAAEAELELSTQQLQQVRARAEVGLALGLDVADAQSRFVRGTRSLLQAGFGQQSARIDLLNATGQLRQQLNP
ncbi:MAG: TolC family protein [Bryobacteraceae bacterium]|nr:TolC family protein [Bryobacteraceae bacterium]